MELNEYQEKISKFDLFKVEGQLSEVNLAFVDKVLGLSGESGEVADKVKKIIRDKDGEFSDQDLLELKKELGDVFWYLATIARYLDISLEEIATLNIEKLENRLARGKISGSGDER